jgi:hypothetical protein
MPWTATTPRPQAQRAEAELTRDPHRSNQVIAADLGCSQVTVFYTRQRLEAAGTIPHVPPAHRLARPRPVSTAALVIAAGITTPEAIAEQAQVTLRTAQRQLQRARPQLPDAAAATDALSVTDTTPDPGSRATEALLLNPKRSNRNVAASARCDEATVRRARQRLERGGEILEFVTEEREWLAPPGPKPGTQRRPPQIPGLPPMPPEMILGGLCVQPDLRPEHRFVWTSDCGPALRMPMFRALGMPMIGDGNAPPVVAAGRCGWRGVAGGRQGAGVSR